MDRPWAFHASPTQGPAQPTISPEASKVETIAQLVSSLSSPSRPCSCNRRVCSGLRSDQRSFARPPMPLRRGISVCAPRAPAAGLCGAGGGGSALARCALLSLTCFLRPPRKTAGALSYQMKNCTWRPAFALETGGSANTDGEGFEEDSGGFLGRTRLGRLIQAAARQLLEKLNTARSNSPTKIFLVLLGFYTANALATILGQTGDWDVLVAGVVLAAIEGIGMLMYRTPMARPPGRFQSLIALVNYWKAGVCLGLFVDAFKLGS